ncbi:MAG TPA: RluA family pseudouridine synthase [Burkholderiales bacterium]|nr:RluA family pseudouridine synthase [Burkholderiales bacterium]
MNDLSKAATTPRAKWVVVGEEGEAQRIDNFLLRELKGVPKSHVYRVLRSGEVRVNSGRVKPDYRLKIGDRVRIPPVRMAEKKPLAPRPLELPIKYEDDALLVVDKPSGVAVHGGSGVSFGVIESLRAARPQAKFLELAHRLDRDTSGLLILCKKRSALVELHRMLREGEVGKVYLAVVRGVAKKSLELRESLHKYVTASGERRVAVQPEGVKAFTKTRKLKDNGEFSLLEVELLTGRTHQIRVHLAHAGHPIVGDDKYGDFALNRELKQRLLLHAARLAFRHPVTGEPMKLESPLPAEMKAFVEGRLR